MGMGRNLGIAVLEIQIKKEGTDQSAHWQPVVEEDQWPFYIKLLGRPLKFGLSKPSKYYNRIPFLLLFPMTPSIKLW